MNSSSVQFFPSRVQLFGLPPTTDLLPRPVRPTMARVQRISRNLFGAPPPGEITQLLQEEQQRQRAYVLQRYNFDIKGAAASKDTTVSSSAMNVLPPHPLNGLISRELREHEQKKCNLGRDQVSAETTPPPHDVSAAKRVQLSQIRRIVAAAVHQCNNNSNNNAASNDDDDEESVATESCIPMGNERLKKPYARQTLLPDFYSLRKTKQYNGRTALTVVTRSPHRLLEVLPLPKPMRVAAVEAATTTSSSTMTTTTTPAEEKSANDDAEEILSLQVSTESTPLATSMSPIQQPQAASAFSS